MPSFLSMATSTIIDLRKLLAERFPPRQLGAVAATRLITGLPFLDQVIGGGLPKGTITELISPRVSAGSASIIHALLQSAARNYYLVALIDGRDSFDPGALDQSSLRHLFWVRCTKASEAIKATDLLLRDGNFPLAIVDLVLNPAEELRKIPQTSWYRLQRLVEPAPTTCLILTRHGIVSSAQLKIILENSWRLENFDDEDALSRVRLRVQRSHIRSDTFAISLPRAKEISY